MQRLQYSSPLGAEGIAPGLYLSPCQMARHMQGATGFMPTRFFVFRSCLTHCLRKLRARAARQSVRQLLRIQSKASAIESAIPTDELSFILRATAHAAELNVFLVMAFFQFALCLSSSCGRLRRGVF